MPVGTIVFNSGQLVVDLKEKNQQLLIAKGGRGGRGNTVFKTLRNTAPRIAEKGEPGESFTLDLELKLLADVGLVGCPNAGKSTFLSRVSSAHPKVADYPFTTLSPNLGVAAVGDVHVVIADIPGLIEGAHEGRGLGDEFLRHIQRTKVIIHLVDINGFENKTAYENYRVINKELKQYSAQLAKKSMLIAVNKMDLTDSDKKLAAFKRHLKGKKIFPLSGVTGKGVQELLRAAVKALMAVPEEEPLLESTAAVKKYVYEPEFSVVKEEDNVFVIRGAKVERLAAMTDFNQEETLTRFQNILKKMGIEKALKEQGISPGDTVRIGEQELIYEK